MNTFSLVAMLEIKVKNWLGWNKTNQERNDWWHKYFFSSEEDLEEKKPLSLVAKLSILAKSICHAQWKIPRRLLLFSSYGRFEILRENIYGISLYGIYIYILNTKKKLIFETMLHFIDDYIFISPQKHYLLENLNQ